MNDTMNKDNIKCPKCNSDNVQIGRNDYLPI